MSLLINKEIVDNIINFKAINERIIAITIRLNRKYKIQILQIYALTIGYEGKEVQDFYKLLDRAIKEEKSNATIIMGDFNTKVGTSDDNAEKSTGKFGSGARDKRRESLIEFAAYKKISIENIFGKENSKRWT